MSGLLTVATGLMSVYIIFALITSHVVEWIQALINSRGKLLYRGIQDLLAGKDQASSPSGKKLAEAIYSHPLVSNLGVKGRPSYIAPRTFTLTLVGSLRDMAAQGAAVVPGITAAPSALLADLQQRVDDLPAGDPLRKSLTLLIQNGGNDYESALKQIDQWYQAQMDRISGTFKRYAAYIAAVIAAIVVYAFNVDTIAICARLWQSSTLASALSSAGTGLNTTDSTIRELLDTAAKAGLVLGWPNGWPGALNGGHLISWLAVLLGAPFWFDILKRITPVRLTGPKTDANAAAKGDKQANAPISE